MSNVSYGSHRTNETNAASELKRAVQRNHSVRGAAVLVVAHVCAIEVEISVWLVAHFACGRYDRGNLPVQSRAGPHFTISQDTVIEPRDSVCVPEIICYAVTGLLHIRPYVNRHVLAHLIPGTGRWQHGIEKPLRCDFPPEPGGRNNRVFTFDIDTNAEDELQIGTVNVSAANEERAIEIVVPQIIKLSIVHTGLTFGSYDY